MKRLRCMPGKKAGKRRNALGKVVKTEKSNTLSAVPFYMDGVGGG